MKLIKSSYEILESQGYLKDIELTGRTCYKSSDKITEDSAKGFVERMIKSGHGAMLEHGTIYLLLKGYLSDSIVENYYENKYSNCNCAYNSALDWAVTTNYRVLVENDWLDDLKYLCEPTKYHEKRIGVRFICDRGVSHEFVRHRVFSFAQESTRYCNYSKDKFGNELTFITPCWFSDLEKNMCLAISDKLFVDNMGLFRNELPQLSSYLISLKESEKRYFKLLNLGWIPQQARSVLPNSLKTELIMTGFVSDWKHFFELRDSEAAHPQARELAQPLHEEFIKRKLL